MGRGIAYPHQYHVIVDEYKLLGDEEEYFIRREEWDMFLEEVIAAFGATEIDTKWVDRESYLFAETDRFYIGCDGGGGGPCIYLKPKTYGDVPYYEEGKPYNLRLDAIRGFNKLIRMYGNILYYWTTAWTGSPYGPTRENPNKLVLYGGGR